MMDADGTRVRLDADLRDDLDEDEYFERHIAAAETPREAADGDGVRRRRAAIRDMLPPGRDRGRVGYGRGSGARALGVIPAARDLDLRGQTTSSYVTDRSHKTAAMLEARLPSKVSKFPGRPAAKVLAREGGDARATKTKTKKTKATKGEREKDATLVSVPPRAESIFARDDPERLLYGAAAVGGDDDEDEASEPLTCFYVEKRGGLRRGAGIAGGGVGPGGRPRGNPSVSRETGRPIAPGGIDDAQPFDRCSRHGARVPWDDGDVEDRSVGGGATRGTPSRRGATPTRGGGRMRSAPLPRGAPPPGLDDVFVRLQLGTPHGPKRPDERRDLDEVVGADDDVADVGRAARGDRGGRMACVCGGRERIDGRVPTLVDLAVAALGDALAFTTRLPPMPPELLNAALARATLDRRTLSLALGAGATRLHVYDFWELCHSFPAAWHCWQQGTSAAAPPPPHRAAPAPACMVEVRDGVLQPSQYDWMRIFPLTSTLEEVSIESHDTEEEDSGSYLRLLLRQLAKTRSLRRLSIAFFDTVTDATLTPLWGASTHGPYEAFDDPTETESEWLAKERAAMGLLPPPGSAPADATVARITRLDLSHLPRITDAAVYSALRRLPHLARLRLEFLAVTDRCIRNWKNFKTLEWLEVRACPYMKFNHPDVDLTAPPPKLRALRIQPGGSARGGRADMTVSARDIQNLSAAKTVTHVCLGCRFMVRATSPSTIHDERSTRV